MIKIVIFDRENIVICWTTWRISMKFSGEIWLQKNSQKKQAFTLSMEDAFSENHRTVKLIPKPFKDKEKKAVNIRKCKLSWSFKNIKETTAFGDNEIEKRKFCHCKNTNFLKNMDIDNILI